MELRLVLLAFIIGICSGLREVRMQTPVAVEKGNSAVLNCWYDLEGATLYAVKWYKGGREFYRFTPNESPPSKTFPIGNLQVNKTESNATQVTLENLELDAAGEYSCEVSADAPSFHTAIVYATMNVAELPTQRPEIHGLRRKYRIDDTLRVNCTLGRSKPAANLTWYVNDRQPLQSHVRTYSPLDTNDSEWQIAQTSLQFLVTPDHFMSGKLKIRCSASIYDIYWQSTEVSAEEERPRVIQLEPAATIVGINYLQPPPNFQTGQRKPDGHLDVKDIESSSSSSSPSSQARLRGSWQFIFELLVFLRLAINVIH
ncbi:GSCOCG00001049001-RA-CDS [Cotesia congregata]|uniref:cell adhesion molecule 3-like isoform X1 n=2 Tax=Cotesia glomerata TaxID=32391 RepID=UPI00175E59B9|nr:cell adhesion molecule 3-like isoform X1 [Cotesia glomerata]CAD6222605.1 GSCOCG00001049001-RA-CDS [Cotesia congregata]